MNDLYQEFARRLEDLERRVKQMVVRGVIAEVDTDKALARVSYGNQQITAWLPWKPIRTGKAIVWWAPEVGEGVTVISDGELVNGEILPGSYYKDFAAPSTDENLFLIEFGDGSKVAHNRETHKLDVVNVGDVELTTKQNLTVNCTGTAKVNAKSIHHNGGSAVVTTAHICHYTGNPHGDGSSTVTAGK
jgi:phage baseplate assembly protein V